MDQLPEDGQQAPNILQDVIDFDSDSEDDEVIVHWPPGLQFLDDEDFILGNLHNNAAPAAWKRANHTRRIIPFNILDQLPENGQQAPNLLQDSDSDSEEDEVILHWPPGLQFLDDEEFILGNFHNNTAPAAWKKTNYTAKPWCSFPICFFLLTDSVPQSMDRLRWTAFTQVNSIARHHHNKGVIEPSNLFKKIYHYFYFCI